MKEIPDKNLTGLSALDYFREINRTFPKTRAIQEHKAAGKKVFGWLCTYVPEEVILAADILPIRITGYTQETELEDGNAYLYINNCSFSRSCLQMGLRKEYDFLDGVVGGSTCDGARRLFDVWRFYLNPEFFHVLTVPRKYHEKAHELYYLQVETFKKHLEEYTGKTITDESLLKSIEVMNQQRKLLKELYDLRKLDEPLITGAETMEVLNGTFRMHKEECNSYLAELINELKQKNQGHKARARIMLIGSVLNNPEFLKSIEELDTIIVTDELCTSTRYWSEPVVLEGAKNPLEAISRRYLNNFPCARMFPSDERFNRIVQLAREARVDGIISETIRYCVPYAHDIPLLSERLKHEDIPLLTLDVEYGTSGSGQIRTRVQAFIEMVEARKK
ncbi:MAG: 2-hydroxyacyl-CoA dehydratase family protein [Dehalococcoidales bacterium]|jgi:benzoyl-CoA reductase subunit C|nr:2-hydroxyacyl-CoA dehydratase family protein [Dehalococcoidales bacterium]